MRFLKLFTVSFVLCFALDCLSVVSDQQLYASDDMLYRCILLPELPGETAEVRPEGNDALLFQQMNVLAEAEESRSPQGRLSYDFLKKIEGFVPQIQSPAFRGRIVMILINEYIGYGDNREVERLVDDELNKPDIYPMTRLRVTDAFVGCRHNIAKCRKLLEDVLRRSDLTRRQEFYFRGLYALLSDSQEKIEILNAMEKEFPEQKDCLAVFLEQAASGEKPEEALMLMSKMSDIFPEFLKSARVVNNYIFLAEKSNNLELAIKIAIEYVQAEPNHPNSLHVFSQIGGLFLGLGEYEKSMVYYQKAIDFPIQDTEDARLTVAESKTNYAVAFGKLNGRGFVPYEVINQKIEFEKSRFNGIRLFGIVSGFILIILWFFIFMRRNKSIR